MPQCWYGYRVDWINIILMVNENASRMTCSDDRGCSNTSLFIISPDFELHAVNQSENQHKASVKLKMVWVAAGGRRPLNNFPHEMQISAFSSIAIVLIISSYCLACGPGSKRLPNLWFINFPTEFDVLGLDH